MTYPWHSHTAAWKAKLPEILAGDDILWAWDGLKAAERNPSMVIDVVAAQWGTTPSAILSNRRDRWCVRPRWAAMYILNKELGMSTAKIGFMLNRHHTTVISGLVGVKGLLKRGDEKFIQRLSGAMNELGFSFVMG